VKRISGPVITGTAAVPNLLISLVEIGRIIRFGIVGVTATLIYASISLLALETLHFTPVSASILGQLVATGVSYFGHSMFSFAVKTDHRTYLWRFLVIAALTFVLNGALTWLMTDVLRVTPQLSIAIVTVVIPVTNYFCNRLWVFTYGLSANLPDSKREIVRK
jgi:putative flippase GtrA